MEEISILLNQLNSIKGVPANRMIIEESLSKEFDISIFPELFYSGYLIRDNIRYNVINEELVDEIKSLIGKRMLIFGAPTYDGFLRNSALIFWENNFVIYNKMHLPNFGPFEEERYFKKGKNTVIVNFRNLKINIQICYDIFFNDVVVQGSDIIVNISASPFTSMKHFESIFPSVAIKNQSYLVYVNTSGLQRNLVFWGGSRVLDPDGSEVLKLPYLKENTSYVTIGDDKIRLSRIKRPILKEVENEPKE